MRDSVVWYFQRLAERTGAERERAYLKAFRYGNEDASGSLTAFWLGTSLQISPLEQLDFLQRFFRGRLPVRKEVVRTVLATIEQPRDRIVNASGEHAMAAPWPRGTTIHAKTGRGIDRGQPVAWLIGRITRGGRAWIFVSCVSGDEEPLAAIKLAAARLRQLQVL